MMAEHPTLDCEQGDGLCCYFQDEMKDAESYFNGLRGYESHGWQYL